MSTEEVVLPWTLRAAVGLVALEALVEAVLVAGRSELTPGLRSFLVLCVGLKWLFAWRVLRLSAGALFGLLLLEGTTVVAAMAASESSGAVRLALGGVALAVLVLLSSSLHAFPSPTLPKG
ncbi:MAG: hypothetical protein ACJ739_14555 [Acidimicrobiales bacterium]